MKLPSNISAFFLYEMPGQARQDGRSGVRGPEEAVSVPRGECSTATRVLNAPQASPTDEKRCPIKSGMTEEKSGVTA